MFVDLVTARIKVLAPVYVIQGEHEMDARAQGILRILRGQEKAHIYWPN
jgi:butyrate kinase